ncbi:MAG: four helix bundle protein, partial [Chlorobia bacterium]|nr:four helix bundle protein [Fimbriimonadaceae bacterium]
MRTGPLYNRTKQFAVDTVGFAATCERSLVKDILIRQLVRSGTSVGANYRAAFRARSNAECIAKLGFVEEEADETIY